MTIPKAIPFQVPILLANFISGITPEKISSATSILEGVVYASIQGGNVGRVVKWMRETTIPRINEIQILFNIANLATVFLYTKEIGKELLKNHSFSLMPVAQGSVLLVLLGFAVYRYLPPKISAEEHPLIRAWRSKEKAVKMIQLTKTVLSVFLAYLLKNRLHLFIAAAASGYSLLKNNRLRWVHYVKTQSFFERRLILKITYHRLVIPFKDFEECNICWSAENSDSKTVGCEKHEFCEKCMNKYVMNKMASIGGTRKHGYLLILNRESLPNCPCCTRFPLQNRFTALIIGRNSKETELDVVISPELKVDKRPFLEKHYASYSVAQAGLAYLQTYPELAATIFKVQRILVFADIFICIKMLSYLYGKVKEKLKITPANEDRFNLAVAVTLVAVSIFSGFAVVQINAYMKPALVIKKLAEEVFALNGVQFSWSASPFYSQMQWVYLNRIITSIALSFFSKQRKTNILSTAFQIANFALFSRLKWIKVLVPFEVPPCFFIQRKINCGLRSHFIVPFSCTTDSFHLKSTLRSIYKYTNQLLVNPKWTLYWQSSGALKFDFDFPDISLDPCGCGLIPKLIEQMSLV